MDEKISEVSRREYRIKKGMRREEKRREENRREEKKASTKYINLNII